MGGTGEWECRKVTITPCIQLQELYIAQYMGMQIKGIGIAATV